MPGAPLSLDLLVSRPTGAPVVRDYLAREPGAVAFFPGHFGDLSAYASKAVEVDGRFGREERARAARAIRVPAGADAARLGRFVDEGGYVVTTGQQPGLFGGPLYSLYKGLTTIRLAQALESRLGRLVLPLFWVASEDHDWAEVNHTFDVGMDNELHRHVLPAPDSGHQPALHRTPAGPQVLEVLEGFLGHLPQTDFSGPYVELLRAAATPDATLPSSFTAILEALLGPYGMVFTDAADAALKEISGPLLLAELERAPELEDVLAATASRLERAGYALQVPVLEGGVNLFLEGVAGRERLYRDGDAFRLRVSGERLSLGDVARRMAGDPRALSPNVLLRPVVESAVFPTLSYVAGPGEIAYYAQLGDYFQAHGVRMPVIHPRHSATVVEAKIRKVLDKFRLDVGDLARPFHEISGTIAREEVPEPVRRALGGLRGAVGKGVGELQEAVGAVDPTLKGTVLTVRSQALSALEEVEKKVLQALKRENQITLSQLEKAQLHLFPEGKPQDRVLNPFYWLARYGGAFLDELLRRFDVDIS